jgi:hypothetical protein
MKKSLLTLGCAVLCLTSQIALADCTYPKAPDNVDAGAATQPEMIAAMSAFKQYNSDVDAYVECLDTETKDKVKEASGAGAIMQIKSIQAKKKTSATEERQAKIDAFNKAVREFKSKG